MPGTQSLYSFIFTAAIPSFRRLSWHIVNDKCITNEGRKERRKGAREKGSKQAI